MTDGSGGGRRTQDPSGWLIVRRDGNVVTAERRACELLGAPDPDALAGREWTSLIAAPEAPELAEVREAIASGGTWDGPLRFRYARDEVTLGTSIAPVARSSDLVVMSLYPAPAAPSHTRSASPAVAPPPRPRPTAGVAGQRSSEVTRGPQQSPTADPAPAPEVLGASPVANDDLRALVASYDAMQDLEDPGAIARAVLQAIDAGIGFDWGAVLEFTGDAPEVTVLATYPTPMAGVSRGHHWPSAGADLALVRSSGEPSINGNLEPSASRESPLSRLPAFGLRSRVLVPLYAGAEVIGALALFRAGTLAFTAAEASLAERTVRRLGDAVAAERATQPARAPSDATPAPGAPEPPSRPSGAAPANDPVRALDSDASPAAGTRLESLGELVAGVAHELNNPLTAILGYAQILGGLEGTEREHALRTIEDEAQRAARIVRNLLSFARQRPGQRRLVNVEEMLRRVIDLRRYALEMDDVHVVTRLGLVPDVLVDEGQFEQVFLNLLNNAQQAMQGHGGEVVVSTWQENDRIYIAFADNGPGVPEELRSRIFEPFFTTREVGLGQGMGLAIVYGVVSHHGGRTWVEENPSGGASFVVELPIPGPPDADGEPGADGERQRPIPLPARAQAQQPPPLATRKRVLVVDDEGAVRALTREILNATGYEVDTAEGGEAALAILEERSFDLVITDLRMPGLDGAGLYRRIVERWPQMEHRVLFVTGDIEGEPGSVALDSSAVHYLEKPFTTRQLLGAVQEALDGRPASQA